jgi:trehalose synthase
VQDGVSGYLVSSVDECANRVLDILNDPDLARTLGRRGKEHVRAHFLTPRYLRDYLKIFHEVM